jgi:hypothetical protein
MGDAIEHRLHPDGLAVAIIGPDSGLNQALCTAIAELPSRRIPFSRAKYVQTTHVPVPNFTAFWSRSSRRLRSSQHVLSRHAGIRARPLDSRRRSAIQRLFDLGKELVEHRQIIAHMSLALYDHHPDEVAVDSGADGIVGHLRLPSTLSHFSPRPDLVVVIDTAVREIGISTEEMSRRRRAYQSFAAKSAEVVVVDGMRPFAMVMDEIIEVITEFTAIRTTRRFWPDHPNHWDRDPSTDRSPAINRGTRIFYGGQDTGALAAQVPPS